MIGVENTVAAENKKSAGSLKKMLNAREDLTVKKDIVASSSRIDQQLKAQKVQRCNPKILFFK